MTSTHCTPTETRMSLEHHQEKEAVASLIQIYLEGGRKGDAATMKSAFRETATIHGHIGGNLLAGPIQLLFDWVDENPPASDLQAHIVNIDVAHSVATARVEIENWLGFQFTDQFTLLKEEGAWIITSKVFHTH